MKVEIQPTEIPGLVDAVVKDDQGQVIQVYGDRTLAQAQALLGNPAVQQDLSLRQVAVGLIH